MMRIGIGELVLCSLAALLPLLGVALVVLLIRGTQKKTDFGVNLSVANACPKCGAALPAVRVPTALKQALWGGWTCQQCKAELDKWGRVRP